MGLDRVLKVVGTTPHMTPGQAEQICAHLARTKARDVLELGFRHGVSTCYMAEQLSEQGGGHITTIDLVSAKDEIPNVESLLTELGLRDLVTVWYEPTSYTWRLMKMLEEDPAPRFDLCYLDGAHNWFVDGFAFFLVDRLLRPGGWIVFDDVNWTYASSPSMRDTPYVAQLPAEERETQQVRKVVDLLVRTHPDYEGVRLSGEWAFVRKSPVSAAKLWEDRYTHLRSRPAVRALAAVNRSGRRVLSSLRRA